MGDHERQAGTVAMSVTRRLYWHVGLLLAQLTAVLAIGWSTQLQSGFPLDDAWIHQTAARNLIEHHTLGVIPGHFGSGTTSVFWVMLLAINYAVLHWPPSVYAALLGVSLLIIAGQAVLYCATRDGWDHARAWTFAALFSISANHVWFALSGMEVCLGTALLVVAVILWFSRPESSVTAVACGVLLALLVLTRPESLLLCAGLLALAPQARRRLSRVAWAALPPLVALIVYFGANLAASGQASPSTLAGQRWLWLQEAADWPAYEVRIQLIARWLDRLWRFTLGEPWLPVFWVLVGFGLLGCVRSWWQSGRIGAISMLAAVQFGTYLLLLPVEGHAGRYQPLVAALFLPLAGEGARIFLLSLAHVQPGLRRVERWVPWLLPIALLPSIAACFAKWSEAQELSVMHVNATEVAAGRWVARLPRDARVASFDIGGISYFGNRSLVDLGGLSDPNLLRDIQHGRIRERLEAEHVEYLIVPMGYSDDFPDPWSFVWRLGLLGKERPAMRRVQEFSSNPDIWVPGLLATLHCAPRQVAYHIAQNGQVEP